MLQVKKIKMLYENNKGVQGVSFEVKPSEILGIIGSNGSGKTTTFKLLLRLLTLQSGNILVNGKDLSQIDKNDFGYLPEERSLYRDLTVYQQLKFFGQLRKMEYQHMEDRIDYWLNRLNIQQYTDKKIEQLSKGNQQKVQFISALLHDPEILILDEPLTGLDVNNVTLFKEIIRQQCEQQKIVLLSSHQFEYIEEFFEKVLVLKEGKMMWYGEVNQLRKSSPIRYLRFVSEENLEYYMEDGVILQHQFHHTYRLKMENETKAKKLLRKILKEQPLISCTIELPTLKDMIQERNLI